MNADIKCPICGANMVLRTAKRGRYKGKKFYGCSRYPKCKGIRNISEG
ncbi:MAG: topoisomerase DNA-binding C4 zinc finger domain-containing protein [Elusimicrobia bacterium]|nr:topoisomerase DNA-binding C4 zinc finger domain-containing protein [Elusimicrobiota bacterium]